MRAHGQNRWENAPAEGVALSNIDRHEVFRILEAARIKGHLLEPVGKSVASVLDRKNVPGKLQRQDKPLIPPDAMREILVNALIHRDYAIAGGAISLAIFDDRVEIWSAGRFPAGITPAMLSHEHDSVRKTQFANGFRGTRRA